jgi:hypothetical protein
MLEDSGAERGAWQGSLMFSARAAQRHSKLVGTITHTLGGDLHQPSTCMIILIDKEPRMQVLAGFTTATRPSPHLKSPRAPS